MCAMWEKQQGVSGQFTTYDYDRKQKVVYIPPGEKRTLVDAHGTGIIQRFWMTFPGWFWQHWNQDAAIDQTILRKLILRIYWDDSPFPSVECPVGDFFGVGHCAYRHFTSKYISMSSGGFTTYFRMPFRTGVRVVVENLHESVPVDIFKNISYIRYDHLPDVRYFHCQYRQGTSDGYEPMEILNVQGAGHYSGCALSIQGKDKGRMYYLEEPEFFFIDGEERPSICGTGLEDYFNGAWYFREGEFAAELYGVPLKDSLNSMISMYRIHEDDPVIFSTGLRMIFDNPMTMLELREFRYSSTAYYYMDAPVPLMPLPPASELVNVYRFRDIDHISIP